MLCYITSRYIILYIVILKNMLWNLFIILFCCTHY